MFSPNSFRSDLLTGIPTSTASLFPLADAAISWPFVRRRFQRLLCNLQLSSEQLADGNTKMRGVVSCLNKAYWDESSESSHALAAGSWGKGTSVRPPRDIDLFFQLPIAVYRRYELRSGNRQSQLLQEVKAILEARYPSTKIRGDGQVVVVPFNTFQVEVLPAFACEAGGYLICDANGGGAYTWVDPKAELDAINTSDLQLNGNVRKLTRLMKQWQRYCDVPLKSFQIEALVMSALRSLEYGRNDEYWFDWLVRDVLGFMIQNANGYFHMPVTGKTVLLGSAWLSKAQSAYGRAVKACDHERASAAKPANDQGAGEEWQKLFGTMIPLTAA